MHNLELIEKGREKPLTNVDDYISKRIKFMIGMYEPFIKEIRDNLYKLISKEVITNFTSDEFELILNGRPYIDVEEWKIFTEYKEPYNNNHYIVKWFWEILNDLSQKELSNLLLFSTGSGRVPLGGFAVLESNRGNIARFTIEMLKEPYNNNHYIVKWFWEILNDLSQKELSNLLLFSTGSGRVPLGGFAELESNRGNIARFTIEMLPYKNGCKNFIKAHTCFNRIDIPLYKNKQEMIEMIKFVANQEIFGFGID